jgi:hypothetical protein
MTITIKIKTDNDAFSDDHNAEVARIVREWAQGPITSAKLRDYNGNTVGSVTVTGK